MTRVTFNVRSALLGALIALLCTEAYAFAWGKNCSEHFNIMAMIASLIISNFFLWITWIPLACVFAFVFGLLIPRNARRAEFILTGLVVIAPLIVLIVAFLAIPYGTASNCVI